MYFPLFTKFKVANKFSFAKSTDTNSIRAYFTLNLERKEIR